MVFLVFQTLWLNFNLFVKSVFLFRGGGSLFVLVFFFFFLSLSLIAVIAVSLIMYKGCSFLP